MGVENVKIEAMKVYYGVDTAQIDTVTIPTTIVKSQLAGKYLTAYEPTGEMHVFWFDTTGTDVAPVVPGATLHKVDISSGTIDTAAEIATTASGVVAAVAGVFTSNDVDNTFTIEQVALGYAQPAHDALQPLKVTGFAFVTTVQGDTELELGCVDGDIETSFEESFIDVKCHANGITPVAQIKNGVSNVEVTLNLQEVHAENLKKMFTKTGGAFTPEGGSELFGMGTFKMFENMFKFATKLRLHPVAAGTSLLRDWTFHKAIPNLSGMTFSGENVQTLPVTFKVFPAEGVNSKINYFSIGDSSQNLA